MRSELERYKLMQELIDKLMNNHQQYSEETYQKIALEAKEQLNMPTINLHILSMHLANLAGKH
ncbi:MAG: hypothetical protein KBD37_09950 [Burkholderiales bacterium]|nr:hypothetical protein [Burkholderiales bacterium]